MPIAAPPIADGQAVIVPDGPYEEGQSVFLLARRDVSIDLFNATPRLCARVDDGPESCDPTRIRPEPIRNPPPETQGVAIDLPRRHFGVTGDRDCADQAVSCRLVWRAEGGQLLATRSLTFTGDLVDPPIRLVTSLGDEPNVLVVEPVGINGEIAPGDVFTERQLATIEADVGHATAFDIEALELSYQFGSVCSFAEGEHPAGSEAIADVPQWWGPLGVVAVVGETDLPTGFAPNCDWRAVEDAPVSLIGDDPVELRIEREIYGYGGWVDCAIDACYIEVTLRWLHPLGDRDDGRVGSDRVEARALLDVPDGWQSVRPSISILEPGPYAPGQVVTVEARDARVDGFVISFCPGGDRPCGFREGTFADGVHRISWTLPGPGSGCGLDRCYFAVASGGEGLAPPAVVVVPIVE